MKQFFLLTLLLTLISVNLNAQFIMTPDTSYYQGFLTDANGVPQNGTFPGKLTLINDMSQRFEIFNDNVDVANGYFTMPVWLESGSLGEFIYIGQNLYLEIEIDGKVFDPPIKIVSVPFAKVAQTADSTLRISDGAITDAKVAANAAISGTKINPDFGAQVVATSAGLDLNGYQVDAILDEDDLASDSQTALATQQSIKAYVDALSVGGTQNLNDVLTQGNDAGAQVIINLGDPVNPQDAATKAYVDANSSDDQVISYDAPTNVITLEDGGTIDLSDLDDPGTDDQTLDEVLTMGNDANGRFIIGLADPVNPQDAATKAYVDAAGDDQDLENVLNHGNDANNQAITGLADPTNNQDAATKAYVDANDTDDQQITYDAPTNVITLEDGGTVDLSDLDDPGTDDQNLILTGDVLTIENGTGSVDLSNYLGTDDQQITYTALTNVLTLEDGGTVDLSDLDDPGTDDQTLDEVLTEGNDANNQAITGLADPTNNQDAATKAYVDANDTDDQQITYDAPTNVITLENGGTVDLSDLDDPGTDDQNLILTGDVLTIENGSGSVDLSNYLGTDDQAISYNSGTNILSLEDGGAVDLSGLNDSGTDDQQLSYNATTNVVTLEDGGTVDLSDLDDPGTDDQQLSYNATTNIVTLEDGGTVDLSDLDDPGTDDQNLILTGDVLTIENGTGSVDLSKYLGTDDQQISYNATTNVVTLEDGGTVDLSDLDDPGTDDQQISYNAGTNIVTLEDGGTVDLSDLDDPGTDDQNLILTGDVLTIENGSGSVDLSNYLGTDDQAISYNSGTNILSLEDGGAVDLSGLNDSGTDDQQLSYNATTNVVTLEDGGTVDLSDLDDPGTDDQQISYNATTNVVTLEDGGTVDLSDLDDPGTDDQQISYNATTNVVTLEDGGTVDLSDLDDPGTDDQQISYNATTNVVTLEDGGTVDLSDLDDPGTDDQTLDEVLTQGNDANNQAIEGLADPTNPQDAATKAYVDANMVDEIDDLTDGKTDATSVFLGENAGENDDGSNSNVALGIDALNANTSGQNNIASGHSALYSNTSGQENAAYGNSVLYENTNGNQNSAFGVNSLYANTTGGENTAAGYMALNANSTGNRNTATGTQSMRYVRGSNNTALGYRAGYGDAAGSNISNNTIIGYQAGNLLEDGADNNILIGHQAGDNVTTGSDNIIIGYDLDAASATG